MTINSAIVRALFTKSAFILLDAQRVLADARQNLAAEKTKYAVNISRLFESLGVKVDYKEE